MGGNPLDTRAAVALLPAMTLPFLASLVYFVYATDSVFAQCAYTATKLFTLVWPLCAYKFVLGIPLPPFKLLRGGRRAVVEGLASGLVVAALTLVLSTTVFRELLAGAAPRVNSKVDELGIREHYLLFALFLSLVHSLLEEYYWRWFVFGTLEKHVALTKAHILAALAFASHHVVVLSQFFSTPWALFFGAAVGIGGLMWSWMYVRRGSLAGPWISHALVDIGIMLIGYGMLGE